MPYLPPPSSLCIRPAHPTLVDSFEVSSYCVEPLYCLRLYPYRLTCGRAMSGLLQDVSEVDEGYSGLLKVFASLRT